MAERAFDEMERALSEFLNEEEERPAAQYVALADLSRHPFVVGHFELESDGSARTEVVDGERAERVRAAARTITGEGGLTKAGKERARYEASQEREAQAPGTTAWLGRLGKADAPREADPAAAPTALAYEALQKLNRGVEVRRERAQKMALAEPAAPRASSDEVALQDAGLAPVATDAMTGRLLPEGQLLLVRAVWSGPRAHRQGVVLDVAALGEWLRTGALARALPDATLTVLPAELGVSTNRGVLRYRHRFAEPFDSLAAELGLTPLPDAPGAANVAWLVALGVGAVALGLVAAWRTVATQLHFAERRSNFVASVSHELKTPLTAIRMYAEMLRDGMVPSEEKRQSYLASITAEAERLSRLIGNVLEFSRLERGARNPELRSADPTPLLLEAAALLRPHVESAGFRLELEIEPALPAVRFGRDALLQVLFNLVDNGVKYGRGAGEAVVEIAARRAGADLELRVRDRGPGVAPEHLPRLREPFYRGGDELTRKAAGSGIGLALVAGLVAEMGGTLSLANAAGGGFEAGVRLRGEPGKQR